MIIVNVIITILAFSIKVTMMRGYIIIIALHVNKELHLLHVDQYVYTIFN
jgi:hypothetical protein